MIAFLCFSSGKQKSLKPADQPEPDISPPTIDVPELSFEDLKEKTDNFGSSSLIGEGSYGLVYHATMDDGRQAAIKKFDASENEPNDEFLKQVNMFCLFSLFNLTFLNVIPRALMIVPKELSL